MFLNVKELKSILRENDRIVTFDVFKFYKRAKIRKRDYNRIVTFDVFKFVMIEKSFGQDNK